MQSTARGRIVVLGTGGTIAGTAADASDNVGYRAGQIGVAELVAAIPALAALPGIDLEAEQVAQLDSKDMDFTTWQLLAQRVAHHLARAEVRGIVVTHGTDTLEETAYFLQRVLAPIKPVVLTGAMRPATALLADGPQNLLDAVTLARHDAAHGVLVAMAGRVHAADRVRKLHPYRLDAFGSGAAGPLGVIEEGRVSLHCASTAAPGFGLTVIERACVQWPWVEIVVSDAGADGAVVRALCAAGVRGIVVEGTGNGSLHHALEAALHEAASQGVGVLRSTRCSDGALVGSAASDAPAGLQALPSAGALTPVQARIELLLSLLAKG